MREIGNSKDVTHTDPSPTSMSPPFPGTPTSIVAATLFVFGSIRALLLHDRLSNTHLAVHLNNRGFPDVDLEKYCAAALANIDDALKLACRLCSLTRQSGPDARYDSHGKAKHET